MRWWMSLNVSLKLPFFVRCPLSETGQWYPFITCSLPPLWSFLFLDFKDYTRKNEKSPHIFPAQEGSSDPLSVTSKDIFTAPGICTGSWAVGFLHLPSQNLGQQKQIQSWVWKPLGICSISTLYFLMKCLAAWLSHKSWPASELTLTNVCCYQNAELPEVNVPCKVQIFQSLGQIICPWVASQVQTSAECLCCRSWHSSSQTHLEFVAYSVGWVQPGQQVTPSPVTHLSPKGERGAVNGKTKPRKLVYWNKDSLIN